ncbi:MAG: hypothetical protein U0136_10700 [Bdellovibrionota bacterium]
MRVTKYSKWTGFDWDDVSLEELMEQLSAHLLESGFQREMKQQMARWFGGGEEDQAPGNADDALNTLRAAIKEALRTSGLLSDEQWQTLFDVEGNARNELLDKMIDQLIAKLLEEGYLSAQSEGDVLQWSFDENGRLKFSPRDMPGQTDPFVKPNLKFEVTRKGIDFLGYSSLKQMLGSFGRASFGSHETNFTATGVEAFEASKPYEFGDIANLDVTETLKAAIARNGSELPLKLDFQDLRVRQSSYRSSCATVLMLDCSHSMILYGEDRFTPAKQVALALYHLIRTQYPGDTLRLVLFHDAAEEVPLGSLASVQVGPYHTNTCEGLKLARRILLAEKKEMRQILMITDGKPSALFVGDTFEIGSTRAGDNAYGRRLYKNSFGLDPMIVEATLAEARECKRSGIMLNTFMLTDDHYLVEFVRLLTQTAEGKAYFTSTDNLGQYLMMDFFAGKRRAGRA